MREIIVVTCLPRQTPHTPNPAGLGLFSGRVPVPNWITALTLARAIGEGCTIHTQDPGLLTVWYDLDWLEKNRHYWETP